MASRLSGVVSSVVSDFHHVIASSCVLRSCEVVSQQRESRRCQHQSCPIRRLSNSRMQLSRHPCCPRVPCKPPGHPSQLARLLMRWRLRQNRLPWSWRLLWHLRLRLTWRRAGQRPLHPPTMRPL